jgi:transcriptional regulator with XRE-family HTH domain
MLPSRLQAKMREQGLSLRGAAEQIGIGHSTVQRALKGQPVDIDSLDAIARWIGVPLTSILDARLVEQTEGFLADMQMLAGMDPEFKTIFEEMFARLVSENMDPRVLSDVVAYAKFRMSQENRGNAQQPARPPDGS